MRNPGLVGDITYNILAFLNTDDTSVSDAKGLRSFIEEVSLFPMNDDSRRIETFNCKIVPLPRHQGICDFPFRLSIICFSLLVCFWKYRKYVESNQSHG